MACGGSKGIGDAAGGALVVVVVAAIGGFGGSMPAASSASTGGMLAASSIMGGFRRQTGHFGLVVLRDFEVLPGYGKIWKFAVNFGLDLMSRFVYEVLGCILLVTELLAIENWLRQSFFATPLSCLYEACAKFTKTYVDLIPCILTTLFFCIRPTYTKNIKS